MRAYARAFWPSELQVHAYARVWACLCARVNVCACTCMRVCACMHVHAHARAYACLCAHVHVYVKEGTPLHCCFSPKNPPAADAWGQCRPPGGLFFAAAAASRSAFAALFSPALHMSPACCSSATFWLAVRLVGFYKLPTTSCLWKRSSRLCSQNQLILLNASFARPL
jgi:hypothetical protein